MEPLMTRIATSALEAVIAGLAIGAALAQVRKIQLALGVKDDKQTPILAARAR